MKILRLGVFGLGLSCLLAGSTIGQAPAHGAEPAMETVAQRGRSYTRRSTGSTRTYRSYSIEPGAGDDAPVVVGPSSSPRSSGSGSTRSSRGSKPSYMRADSKAHGRYHQ